MPWNGGGGSTRWRGACKWYILRYVNMWTNPKRVWLCPGWIKNKICGGGNRHTVLAATRKSHFRWSWTVAVTDPWVLVWEDYNFWEWHSMSKHSCFINTTSMNVVLYVNDIFQIVLAESIKHPFSIAVFENKLYWSDFNGQEILSCNKFTGRERLSLARESNSDIYGVHFYHNLLQKTEVEIIC